MPLMNMREPLSRHVKEMYYSHNVTACSYWRGSKTVCCTDWFSPWKQKHFRALLHFWANDAVKELCRNRKACIKCGKHCCRIHTQSTICQHLLTQLRLDLFTYYSCFPHIVDSVYLGAHYNIFHFVFHLCEKSMLSVSRCGNSVWTS